MKQLCLGCFGNGLSCGSLASSPDTCICQVDLVLGNPLGVLGRPGFCMTKERGLEPHVLYQREDPHESP